MVPHSYKHLPEYKLIDHSHTVIMHSSLPFLAKFKNSSEHSAIANWQNVKQVEVKWLQAPQQQELELLQNFLFNDQPFKVLHVSVYDSAQFHWIFALEWSAQVMILDLHDYKCQHTMDQRLADHAIDFQRFQYADYHWMDQQYRCLKSL